MTETLTSRLGLRKYGAGTDGPSRLEHNADVDALESVVAMFLQDTRANRPPAGVKGRTFTVVGDSTAALNGLQFYDDGTSWVTIGLSAYGVSAPDAATTPWTVNGFTGQSAPLTQWRPTPGAANVAAMSAAGDLTLNSLIVTTALAQAKTHASPDTDSGTTALHHTLGTGANQAAAGNHTHTGVYEPVIAAGTTGQYLRGDKTWQTLNATAVGLSNVNNTSDANKPVSTAQQAALDLKAPLASPTFTGTVGGITKSMVGLANVDNTSDANKPVSTAVQTALNAKQDLIVAGTTSQYRRGDNSWQTLDKAAVGLSNVDNTSDANKPISSATATALAAKAPLASPAFTTSATLDGVALVKSNDTRLLANVTAVVYSGGWASRPGVPAGFSVLWIGGTVAPSGMVDGDLWFSA